MFLIPVVCSLDWYRSQFKGSGHMAYYSLGIHRTNQGSRRGRGAQAGYSCAASVHCHLTPVTNCTRWKCAIPYRKHYCNAYATHKPRKAAANESATNPAACYVCFGPTIASCSAAPNLHMSPSWVSQRGSNGDAPMRGTMRLTPECKCGIELNSTQADACCGRWLREKGENSSLPL